MEAEANLLVTDPLQKAIFHRPRLPMKAANQLFETLTIRPQRIVG
jgi:hypothetical protein